MAYKCYLFDTLMPETPAKLYLKIKGRNSTISLLNDGEINILKSPGLTEITLPLTLPMLTAANPPDYYLELLEKAKIEKTTTQFILTRETPSGKLLFDTNIKISVEDYKIDENAKNGLDLSVDVNLKQYRDYGTTLFTINESNTDTSQNDVSNSETVTVNIAKERDSTNAPQAATYTVKQGDTLWAISKTYLGDGAKYNLIYEANKDKISNPNIIYTGQVLTIPQV